jgi:hypothetical protein
MRTDGQTDMTKLIVPFRNFANAPKMDILPSPLLPIRLSVRKNSNVAERGFLSLILYEHWRRILRF